jgi:hypothetical protein
MKRFFSWLWVIPILLSPVAVNAQALLAGSEYYDSFETIAQVVILKAAHNEAGRDYLVREGHILPKSEASLPIIVIARGSEPESGCEFRFPAYPRTYWTFTENIATLEELKGEAQASPSPEPSPVPAASVSPEKVIASPSPSPLIAPPTPEPTAVVVEATPSPSPKKKKQKKQTTEHGAIEWHKVNGQWKWRPLDRSQFKGWEAGAKAPSGNMSP